MMHYPLPTPPPPILSPSRPTGGVARTGRRGSGAARGKPVPISWTVGIAWRLHPISEAGRPWDSGMVSRAMP